jgi:hypothetical protein
MTKKITVQYKQQNSRTILTKRRINNNVLVVQVIQKSCAHYMQLSWAVRSVSTGAFSLNGHDSSYVVLAKNAVLKVPV